VTGGIASYKGVLVARLLTHGGAETDVVLTRGAREFIGPVTFEGVTGRAVRDDMFAPGDALSHIRLAREADAVLIAPATADFIARAAHGRADDLLAAVLLATTAPVVIAPAMNDRMWAHPQTVANVARLREIGYRVIEPDTGALAIGEGHGPGRLPDPEVLLEHLARALAPPSPLAGRRIVVTAGATREPIDPVRFVSNHSSGRMGVALAAEAWRRGADVTLVAGAMTVRAPVTGVALERVETTTELAAAVTRLLPEADVLVMAAAPADFRATTVSSGKIKKGSAPASLALEPTIDVLASTIGRRRPGAVMVGFALETERLVERAGAKLAQKQLDLIVANPASEPDSGFDVATNRVALIGRDGAAEQLPLLSKADVAARVLDRVEALLDGR